MEDWIKAGNIARDVLKYAVKISQPGTKILKIADLIETKIFELGGKPAFPVNLSLNHIAAHYTPSKNDEKVFEENDLMKIDVGVHVNGAIGDSALTVGSDKKLIKVSEEALKSAIKVIVPGVELREIGLAINEVAESYELNTIKNLSGHGLNRFIVHDRPSIPNYDNGDKNVLKEGQIIAIEPFITGGVGAVVEGGPSNIYKLNKIKPIRHPIARKIMGLVKNEYNTLPFAKRWIEKSVIGVDLGISILVREGVLHSYNQLPEKSKHNVAQAEHTLIVNDKVKIIT